MAEEPHGRRSAPGPGAHAGRTRAAQAAPALLLAAVAAALAASATLRGALGLGRRPLPLADLVQVTATAGCASPGAGRIGSSVCDPDGRPYNYPAVWYRVLHGLGVGPGATVPLALLLVVLALGALTLLLVRLDLRGRALGAAALLVVSPPMWLLVVRANTDLLLLALLAVCVVVPRSRVLAPGLLVLGTALKLYPLGAVAGRLQDRRQLAVAAVAGGVGVLTLVHDLGALRAATPSRVTTSFGAGVLPALLRAGPDADVAGQDQVLGATAVVLVAAGLLVLRRSRDLVVGLAAALDRSAPARCAVGTGAGLFLVADLGTTSYDYRLFGLVFLGAGLLAVPAGGAGRVVVALAVVTCWAAYPWRDLAAVGDLAGSLLAAGLVALTVVLGLRALRRRPARPGRGARHPART